MYLWFIYDTLFIWTGTISQPTNCLNYLNKKHTSIKFEYKISQLSILYLDTEVSSQNSKLVTKICQKGTDGQNLDVDSQHP